MHIGNFVQKRGSKGTIGYIAGRAPIYACWNVRWTKGERKGTFSIVPEEQLVLTEKSSS